MKIFRFLLVLMLFNGCLIEPSIPNIVLILVDDLGISQLSSFGNTYNETPNIDHLSKEGCCLIRPILQQRYIRLPELRS